MPELLFASDAQESVLNSFVAYPDVVSVDPRSGIMRCCWHKDHLTEQFFDTEGRPVQWVELDFARRGD